MDLSDGPSKFRSSSVTAKKIKISENESPKNETDSSLVNQNNSTVFSLLPSEIILDIFQYLSPLDLLNMMKLGDQRLCELTFTTRRANFSSCHQVHLEQVSAYFSRIRVKLITELSFNFMVYIKPVKLSQVISRCKNLLSLSVIESGIKYDVLLNILDHCPKLEKLAWNMSDGIKNETRHTNMKTLFLFCPDHKPGNLINFVEQFPEVKNVFVNFVSDYLIVPPLIGLWSNTKSNSNIKRDRSVCFTRNKRNISEDFFCQYQEQLLHHVLQEKVHRSLKLDEMLDCPPYLLIRSREEDISLVLSDPSKRYSTVIIRLTADFYDVSENLLKCIKEVSGHRLMNISLELEKTCSKYFINANLPEYANKEHFSKHSSPIIPMPLSPLNVIKVCDFFEEMFITCRNITVFNIATVHFTMGSPFKALCQLPKLRILSMASCAFFKSFNFGKHGDSWPLDRCQEFKNVVACCPEIQSFHLVCCLDGTQKVTEDDLLPLKDWKHLNHLFLYSVTFRSCRFLRHVADHCLQLKSFTLVEVAKDSGCIFVSDIIYLLKTAKNLSFIRINEMKFNPMYEGFLNAVGKAENLEGICICTKNNLYVETKTVINEIKKLKFLHLFHFAHPRACDSLYAGVKKCMLDNGIANFKIVKDCCNPVLVAAELDSFYHLQPEFSCSHLHPLDIPI